MPSIKRTIPLLFLFISLFLAFVIPYTHAQTIHNTSVSLTVPLRESDIPISLERTNGQASVHEDEEITYQITYGSLLSFDIPLTLKVTWSDSTINESLVNIAQYVEGSGTDAYGGTPAVIDTIHKTISWNIPSLPANTTDQTVSFKLRTNSNYDGPNQISFDISAWAQSNGESLTPISMRQYYVHTKPDPSASSVTPTTATSITTPTPTLTALQKAFPSFTDVTVQTIASNSATAIITLTSPAKITIRYGLSPTQLTKVIRLTELVETSLISFSDLLPKTPYYFTITAENVNGSTTSDIYTFTTAKNTFHSFIDLSSLIVSADNTIITSGKTNEPTQEKSKSSLPSTIITSNTPFEFRFTISNSEIVRKIEAIVRNAKILGINTFSRGKVLDASTDSVEIVEISKGVYSGRLKTKLTPGNYTIFARISDEDGNIFEQPISSMIVVQPLTILDAGSKHPVESARILFYREQLRTHTYTVLSDQLIAVKNPVFSEPDGTVNTNLIQGNYKIKVSATGYKQQEVYFTISPDNKTQYPIVYLIKDKFSFFSTAQFYSEVSGDLVTSFITYVGNLSDSNRLFKLASFVSLCFFVLLTIFSFCVRFHIPLTAIPAYLLSLIHLHRQKHTAKLLSGTVKDEKDGGFPIGHAIVYLLDKKRRRILIHTQTNSLGEFHLLLPQASSYLLVVKKRHYLTVEHTVSSLEGNTIILEKDLLSENRILPFIRHFIRNVFGLLFEMLLVLSLALEAIFMVSLGAMTVTPYLILTIGNLVIWLLFIKNQRLVYAT